MSIVATRIAKLPRNLLRRTYTEGIVPQINGSRVAGYAKHNSTCILKKNHQLSRLSINNFNSTAALLYSTEYNELSSVQYEKVCDLTLDSLSEYFEELVEAALHLSDTDVTYGDGVLTVKFGEPHGTYVINRQTPNKQIWLSSPKSGPKRYDFMNGQWIYKHDGKSLHELLDDEIPTIVKSQVCFASCCFSGRESKAVMDSFNSDK